MYSKMDMMLIQKSKKGVFNCTMHYLLVWSSKKKGQKRLFRFLFLFLFCFVLFCFVFFVFYWVKHLFRGHFTRT